MYENNEVLVYFMNRYINIIKHSSISIILTNHYADILNNKYEVFGVPTIIYSHSSIVVLKLLCKSNNSLIITR